MSVTNNGVGAIHKDAWLIDGMRTPFADYNGALGQVSPIDLGIKAALAHELARSGTRYGIACACIGGGQGIAMLIENTSFKGAN